MAKWIASSGANSNWGFAPLLVGLAFAALVPQAGVDTLARHHFEEKEVGEQATCAANAIADSSERAKHGTEVPLNHMTEGTDETLAPTYRDPLQQQHLGRHVVFHGNPCSPRALTSTSSRAVRSSC